MTSCWTRRSAGTPFDGQTTLKLGTGCDDTKEHEQITLREYVSYPLFSMVTPWAFRARLARGTYVDESSKKKGAPRYALFIENENDVARRNEGRIVELPRISFSDETAVYMKRADIPAESGVRREIDDATEACRE